MFYQKIQPGKELENFVECFWVIESDETISRTQKIIPDGFPEIIFHYGDAYRINIHGNWETQAKSLIAGQIKNHFHLQNSGASGIVGIKFKPAAIRHLFDLNMSDFTERVVPLAAVDNKFLRTLEERVFNTATYTNMIDAASGFLVDIARQTTVESSIIDGSLAMIFSHNGTVSVAEICNTLFVTERQLQRIFKKYVGLSPKLYARIIRFSYIFQLVQRQKKSWLELSHLSGYFDQSHFIKNFKIFSGEDPSAYVFDEPTMANFFLNKP